ncbi:MAG: serine hydrolase [Clostridia bacterium]|nr:serine hydrolase [Clostridia bacterium]
MDIYYSDSVADEKNENHQALEKLFDAVKEKTPELKVSEAKKPFADDNRIKAVYFNGENYNGKESEVFAYIGFPEGASADAPVPAMVLIHGGSSHACADWVQYWVDNGYAAISFDGFAQHPFDGEYKEDNSNWEVNPASHPTIDEFRSAGEPLENQWFYYYITDAILANNILRADSRVKKDNIGVTGISWGSVATSVVMCYDNRFSFAVPVYGSGFNYESQSMFGPMAQNVKDVWDPAPLLKNVEMPVLFVNGDSDPFFTPNITVASVANMKNASLIYDPKFAHGMHQGMYEPEVMRFANEQSGMGEGNIKITSVDVADGRALISFDIPKDIKNPKVYAYYRTAEFEFDFTTIKEPWSKKSGIVLGSSGNVKIPEDFKYIYFLVQGKSGKIFNKEEVYASTGIYTKNYIESMGAKAKIIDAEKLKEKIEKTVNNDIKLNKVGGTELIVNQFGERVYDGVFGYKDIDNKIPLEKNAMYRIASMTKPVTAVALLMEAEKGKVDLNADVSDYLDGFDNMYVGKIVDGKVVPDKKAENSIKVYQLVSHMSGICSGAVGDILYAQIPVAKRSIAYITDYLKDKPLSFDPGTAQEYNNIGFDIAARIIELSSGMPFDEYLKVNLFEPLGMKDTTFVPTDAQWDRFISVHSRTDDGKQMMNAKTVAGSVFGNNPKEYFMAGGGLASTAEDYMLFAEMLLNEGVGSNGTRVLSQKSVELMKTPCISKEIMPGNQQWGLGVRVVTEKNYKNLPVGAFGWSGAYGTHFWVDPVNRITAVYMKNSTFEGGAGARTANEFEENVFKSLK